MVAVGGIRLELGSLLLEGLLIDVAERLQDGIAAFEQWGQTGQVGGGGDEAEADKAQTYRFH